jgi:hypothetical protein
VLPCPGAALAELANRIQSIKPGFIIIPDVIPDQSRRLLPTVAVEAMARKAGGGLQIILSIKGVAEKCPFVRKCCSIGQRNWRFIDFSEERAGEAGAGAVAGGGGGGKRDNIDFLTGVQLRFCF